MSRKLTEFNGNYDGNSDRYEYIPVPIITNSSIDGFYDTRRCNRRNFIPNRHVGNVKPEIWRETYGEHITDIYRVIRRIIEEEFPNIKINWENTQNIDYLIKLLFYSSSKHIPDYMVDDNNDKEPEEKPNEEPDSYY
jgi:endo-1,4-beta-D-glucanase Y